MGRKDLLGYSYVQPEGVRAAAGWLCSITDLHQTKRSGPGTTEGQSRRSVSFNSSTLSTECSTASWDRTCCQGSANGMRTMQAPQTAIQNIHPPFLQGRVPFEHTHRADALRHMGTILAAVSGVLGKYKVQKGPFLHPCLWRPRGEDWPLSQSAPC